jgi:hypothetical protein
MGDGPRGTPVGLHSTLFWGSATCDALVNPANLQSFTCHPWRSRRRGPFVQSSSSGRLRPAEERCDRTVWPLSGPPRVATCRPALATARTVWQWHSGGEREGAVQNGGSLCGHIAHTHDRSLATAIIALHSPRAPTVLGSIAARHSGCDLRHRQQTAVCASPRLRLLAFRDVFDSSNYAGAHGRPGRRPRRHAVAAVRQSNA